MIPQDSFVIVAPVEPDRTAKLRALLATMNFPDRRGFADPRNELFPFGAFDTIHFARFVVLADNTLADRAYYPGAAAEEALPVYLCFMVDCDGDAGELMEQIGLKTEAGLREIFRHCKGFGESTHPLDFMREYRVQPRTSYVNWVGRTVADIRHEARLHDLLRDALGQTTARDPQLLRAELKQRVRLDPPLQKIPPVSIAWRLQDLAHFLLPIAAALLATLLAVWLAVLATAACWRLIGIWWTMLVVAIALVLLVLLAVRCLAVLRTHEQTDPIVPQPHDMRQLRDYEDHDVSNQYTAMGSIKPGRFRLRLEIAILHALNWIARHICNRGALGRISTIHFAHWSPFLDDNRRGFFCSNYDGGHEAYMDDFINKAGFGLNFSFSSFIAYPTTAWLFARGAWLEQDFKRFQRHHQIPTDVWYKAYPGLTLQDLARNSRIRNGYEMSTMNDDEIRRWVAEI
jgi:membrane protein implicated in regulation of membrane protease activity